MTGTAGNTVVEKQKQEMNEGRAKNGVWGVSIQMAYTA